MEQCIDNPKVLLSDSELRAEFIGLSFEGFRRDFHSARCSPDIEEKLNSASGNQKTGLSIDDDSDDDDDEDAAKIPTGGETIVAEGQ